MNVLVVDVGNTRIKWARLGDEGLGASRAAVHARWRPADYARRLLGGARVERMLVSSVAGPQVKAALRCAAREQHVPLSFVAVPAQGSGIRIAYREPWRLGVDRFIGMVGAHQLVHGCAGVRGGCRHRADAGSREPGGPAPGRSRSSRTRISACRRCWRTPTASAAARRVAASAASGRSHAPPAMPSARARATRPRP